MDIFKLIEPTERAAIAWLRALAASPHQFHIDDSPADQINTETGKPAFTKDQARMIDTNLCIVFAKLGSTRTWDIYGEACGL